MKTNVKQTALMIQITFAGMEGSTLQELVKEAKSSIMYNLGASLLSCVLLLSSTQCESMYKWKAQVEQCKYDHLSKNGDNYNESYNYASGCVN
jgi:uncharacterized protein involved in tolerance to divalent cations